VDLDLISILSFEDDLADILADAVIFFAVAKGYNVATLFPLCCNYLRSLFSFNETTAEGRQLFDCYFIIGSLFQDQ
jgi:hypothetical protein